MADAQMMSRIRDQWGTQKHGESASTTVKLIGAGLPRTGTSSTLQALNILGYGPVIHMAQNFEEPDRCAIWRRAFKGQKPDWRKFLAGFTSTIDSPCCDFYQDFMDVFPDAKVLLTVRDSGDVWYKSFAGSIGQVGSALYRAQVFLISTPRKQSFLHRDIVTNWKQRFGSIGPELHDRHNEEVRKHVPSERLLEFNVKQGWEPLCKFLDVPIPDEPFPHVNDTKDIVAMLQQVRTVGTLMWAGLIGTLAIGLGLALKYQSPLRELLGWPRYVKRI